MTKETPNTERVWQLVILESPYSGEVERNVAYARRCVADCVKGRESPQASHLLFTQPGVLDDNVAEERALGIAAGLAWKRVADYTVFYTDMGWSRGMLTALSELMTGYPGSQPKFRLRALDGPIKMPPMSVIKVPLDRERLAYAIDCANADRDCVQ